MRRAAPQLEAAAPQQHNHMRSSASRFSPEAGLCAPPRHRTAPRRAPQHRTAPTVVPASSFEHASRASRSPMAAAMRPTRSAPSLARSHRHASAGITSHSPTTETYDVTALDAATILAARGSFGRSASNVLVRSSACRRTVPQSAATPAAYSRWVADMAARPDRVHPGSSRAESASEVLGPRKTRQLSRRTFFSLGGSI